MQILLELVDVHTYYGDIHVLHGVSLEVLKGAVAVVLGRNGMGKTTTIRSIIGFTVPRHGAIKFEGKELIGLQPYLIAQLGLGLVPQGRCIFPSLSVKENLIISAKDYRKSEAWTLDRVYDVFPILKERANCSGKLLSGGEQSILSIARALMTNPSLVLMDEPSEGLAPLIVQHLGDIIKQLRQCSLSILLVEQNLRLALSVGDYVFIMNKGIVVFRCTAEELSGNEKIKDKYLGIVS